MLKRVESYNFTVVIETPYEGSFDSHIIVVNKSDGWNYMLPLLSVNENEELCKLISILGEVK